MLTYAILIKIFKDFLSDPKTVIVISNVNIKKNVAISILHVHSGCNILAKTIHHAVNITSTKAELFTIRCGINQAVQVENTTNIIVIIDAIHTVRWIFDSFSHPYQLQSITIAQDLRAFYNKSSNNSIAFWDCPSSEKWIHHLAINKGTKQLYCESSFPCKSSWDFNKKEECDSIIQNWQMTSDYKGNHFLFDDNYLPIKPTYTKDGTWLKLIGHSNSLCARATRAITNHASIGNYCLRFFPKENFNCPCRSYPIESRCHILHKCRRYNNYWNPNRESLNHFVTFLEFNPGAYSFHEGIT